MAKKSDAVHVLSVKSESGDDYGPFLFRKRPTGQKLLDFLMENTSECDCGEDGTWAQRDALRKAGEDLDGPGWMGTHLHLTWSEDIVR